MGLGADGVGDDCAWGISRSGGWVEGIDRIGSNAPHGVQRKFCGIEHTDTQTIDGREYLGEGEHGCDTEWSQRVPINERCSEGDLSGGECSCVGRRRVVFALHTSQ